MNAITIGPLMLNSEWLSGGAGLATFLVLAAMLGALVDRRLSRWADHALWAGLIAARIGYVLNHYDSFVTEPWRAFAVWQGGFSLLWGLAAVAIVSIARVRSIRAALGSAATIAASLLVWTATKDLVSPASAQSVPNLQLERLDGRPMMLTQTSGKPIVLNLWATWCSPCRKELPLLSSAARARRDDVLFLFANQGEEPGAIKAFLQSQHLALENVLLDRSGALPQHYKTPGIPVTLFVRPDGSLMTAFVGEISPDILADNLARLVERK